MPYIGNTPAEKYASYDVQHITTSATTSYVLDKNVANENEIRVVLNNIIQQPGASYAYTASANTLTLSVATTSNDTLYVVFTGKAVQTVTPPPSSVGLAQLNATGSPGTNTFLRGDNSWATPSDSVSYLVKISSDDTTPDFLNGKLVAGTGISLTEGSGGGDETLTIANTSPGTITAFTNGVDNRVVTATSATALNGEASLTFDGEVLTLEGNPTTVISQPYNLSIRNNDATATSGNAETGILFRANYSDSVPTDFAGITAGKENTNNGDYGGFISLNTRTNGVNTIAERLRITSSGAVLIKQGIYAISDENTGIQFDGSDIITVHTGGNQVMKFQANRTVQINGGTGRESTVQIMDGTGTGYEALSTGVSSTGNATQIAFRNPNGTVGYINTNGTATSYGTSSDYRLKENVSYEFDATTRLKQLKPARFNFIADADTTVDGFIAHEVSSIVPEAISGEKDALEKYRNADETPEGKSVGDNKLDENGDTMIDAQSIDQSKLVPLLVKTIQELEARITTLENA